jgi:hypothetical protein
VGRFRLSIYEVLSSKSKQKVEKEDKEAQKEKVYETKDILRENLNQITNWINILQPTDQGVMCPKTITSLGKSIAKNNHSIIRSINSRRTSTQKTYDQISTD